MENNQNTSAILLQNQNSTNNVTNVQGGTVKSTWAELCNNFKADFNAFTSVASNEVKEGVQDFLGEAKKEFGAFAAALESDVKGQVNALVASLTKEANEVIKPELNAFATDLGKKLEATGEKILANVWSEAETVVGGMAQSIMSDITSGKKVDIAAIAKDIMSSDKMKGLIDDVKTEVAAGFSTVVDDAKSLWTGSLKQELTVDAKKMFVDFGKNVAEISTKRATELVGNLKSDLIAEVDEVKNELIESGKKSLATTAKDLLHDAGNLAVAAGKSVVNKVASWFKKK